MTKIDRNNFFIGKQNGMIYRSEIIFIFER